MNPTSMGSAATHPNAGQFNVFLKHKLAWRVTLGSLVFALLAGAINTWFVFDRRNTESLTLQNQLAATVKTSASVAAFANNVEIARDVVTGLLSHPLVASAGIVNDKGAELFGSLRPGSTADERVRFPLHSPVMENEVVGYLFIAIDRSYVWSVAWESALRQSVVLVLQIAMGAFLVIIIFDVVVAQPLNSLARRVSDIVPGSGARLAIPRRHENDEIGSLASSANNLLANLDRTLQEERELRAKVEKMEAHYRRIFETTNVGIMVLGPNGALINSNPALLSRIVGIRFEGLSEVERSHFIESIFVEPSAIQALVTMAAQSGRSTSDDCQLKTDDGSVRWAHCIVSVVLGPQEQIELIEGVLYDVTARRLEEDHARRAADHDALTGLHNRRGMEVFLNRSLRHATEAEKVVGMLLLDLDGFKAVNDTQGHDAGDQVLKGVASRMLSRIRRSSDLVARLGGDEFVVIASDCGADIRPLEEMAHDLVVMLGEPFTLSDGSVAHIGASIGIARFPQNGATREAVIAAADAAMYAAKKAGKNRYTSA